MFEGLLVYSLFSLISFFWFLNQENICLLELTTPTLFLQVYASRICIIVMFTYI